MSPDRLPSPNPEELSPALELSEAEERRIALLKERIKKEFPALFPILRGLMDAGLIRGLRDLDYLGPERPAPRNAISTGQMVLDVPQPDKESAPCLPRTRYK